MLKTILGNQTVVSSNVPLPEFKPQSWQTSWLFIVMGVALVLFFPVLFLFFVTFDESLANMAGAMQNLSWKNFQTLYSEQNNFSNFLALKLLSKELYWFQLSPRGYHAINLVLHSINAGLAFYAVWLLTKRNIIAFIAGILFAIHPIKADSVAAILGQGELIMAFFALLSIICYLRYHNLHKDTQNIAQKTNLNNPENTKYLHLSLLFFVLAVLTKFTALALPFVFLLIDNANNRQQQIKKWTEKIGFFILVLVGLGFFINLQMLPSSKTYFGVPDYNVFDRLILVLYTIAIYLKNLFLPYNLSPFYAYPQKTSFFLPWYCYVGAMITILLSAGVWKFKQHKWLVFGTLFFLVQLVLISNIFHIGGRTFAHDEHIYFSSLGIFIVIGYAADYIWTTKPTHYLKFTSVFVIALLGLVLTTYFTTKTYSNGITFLTRMVETNPDHYYTRLKRGEIRMLNEETYREGMMDLNIALEKMPDDPDVWTAKGLMHLHIGDYIVADTLFTEAIKRNPAQSMAYFHRAHVHKGYERFSKAIENYDLSIKYNPNYAPAYLNRGGVKQTMKDYLGALKDYDKAIKLNPNYGEAYLNKGNVLYLGQGYQKALESYNNAIQLLPQNAEAFFYRGLTRINLNDKAGACMDLEVAKNLGNKDAEKVKKDVCK
jgi:tetratricopeptide (TPR) repeat protein